MSLIDEKKSDDYSAFGYSKLKSDLQIGFYNHVWEIPTLSVTFLDNCTLESRSVSVSIHISEA